MSSCPWELSCFSQLFALPLSVHTHFSTYCPIPQWFTVSSRLVVFLWAASCVRTCIAPFLILALKDDIRRSFVSNSDDNLLIVLRRGLFTLRCSPSYSRSSRFPLLPTFRSVSWLRAPGGFRMLPSVQCVCSRLSAVLRSLLFNYEVRFVSSRAALFLRIQFSGYFPLGPSPLPLRARPGRRPLCRRPVFHNSVLGSHRVLRCLC